MSEIEGVPPEPNNGAGPTAPDEMEVLRKLYGEPDEDGVFRGEGK